jgi:hypothetical protein
MTVAVGRTVEISGKNLHDMSHSALMNMIRFQRKEYASIEIVLTEKKGYGLRAERDLPK